MKKLIALAAIATCGAALAVESANIVGYSTSSLEGKSYNATGPCFISTGSEGTFTLANAKPTAYNWQDDFLYVINADDCSADVSLTYLDEETAAEYSMQVGWYNSDTFEPYNDVEWDVGTGFMSSFGSQTPNITYSGEVFNDPFSMDCRGKAYVMIPNALPRTLKLGEVSATGFNWQDDFLYIINAEDCSADVTLVYLDEETAAEYSMTVGWYDSDTFESYDDYEIAPGTGFQSSFGSGSVILNFPAAY